MRLPQQRREQANPYVLCTALTRETQERCTPQKWEELFLGERYSLVENFIFPLCLKGPYKQEQLLQGLNVGISRTTVGSRTMTVRDRYYGAHNPQLEDELQRIENDLETVAQAYRIEFALFLRDTIPSLRIARRPGLGYSRPCLSRTQHRR